MGVNGYGDVYTFDGVSWSGPVQADPRGDGGVDEISCASPTFCVVVDDQGYAVTWDGAGWSARSMIDSKRYIYGVSCLEPAFCLAVDNTGHFLTFDGTTWSTPAGVPGVHGGFFTVSCGSRTFCVAGKFQGRAAYYDGSDWTLEPVGMSGMQSVSCSSEPFCVGVVNESAEVRGP
jgi:hypothetical protein